MMTETAKEKRHERTCAGCGKRDSADALVRLVLDPSSDEVAVDLAGSSFGRGAHVHATTDCVTKAAKSGLSRAFKANVKADARAIGQAIADAAERRVLGLLGGAKRGKLVAIGADSVVEAIRSDKALLVVVARDAAAAANLAEVRQAVDAGKAVAFGVKASLGALLGKEEVAVCAILDAGVAKAIASAETTARPFMRSDAWWSEVR